MIRVLISGQRVDWDEYGEPLLAALTNAGIEAEVIHERMPRAPETIDYIIYAPWSDMKDFSPFTGAKAVINLWAGVEDVVTNDSLKAPLVRMVDPGLTGGMVEWCVAHALRHHLGIDRDVCRRNAVWDQCVPPLARERPLTILGLGVLGRAVAEALSSLGFPVAGWSRSAKDVPGVTCLSGEGGLVEALRRAELLILLLPLTPATEELMNSERLALLPKGAILINPGRGPLIDDDALLAALDSGHIAHATLDVFREEPLPGDHPFWAHPGITVTPHVASATRPDTAVGVIVENIRRGESGKPLLHLVDRRLGY